MLILEQQLIAVVTDLFAMGIEATSTTLRWALLIMCRYPQVQAKVQVEFAVFLLWLWKLLCKPALTV